MTTYLNEPILTIYYTYNPDTGQTKAFVNAKEFQSLQDAWDYIEKVKDEARRGMGNDCQEGEGGGSVRETAQRDGEED